MDRQINLMDLLKLYAKRWWCLVLAAVVGGVLSGLITNFFVTPMYTSYGTLYTENSTDIVSQNLTDINLNTVMVRKELVKTYAEVLSSNAFLNKVSNESGLGYNSSQIRSMISMTDKNETEILVVSVTSPIPEHSFIVAQKIVDLAPGFISEKITGGNVEPLDQPELSTSPSSPNLLKNVEIGMFLGLLLSLIIVFAVELLDNKVKDADSIADTFKYPILGEVPYFTATTKKEIKEKKNAKIKKSKEKSQENFEKVEENKKSK